MAIKKDKTFIGTVHTAAHGCTLTVTASTAYKQGEVLIRAEEGIYGIEELEEAIKAAKAFDKKAHSSGAKVQE